MAKKKKHRKSKAQKRARQQQTSSIENQDKITTEDVRNERSASENINSSSNKLEEMSTDSYVKSDIVRSISLIGIILAVYIVIFLLLEKTNFGLRIYSLFKF